MGRQLGCVGGQLQRLMKQQRVRLLQHAGQMQYVRQLQRRLGELQVTFDEVSDGLLYLCCAGISGDLLSVAAAAAVSADGRPINAYDLLLNTAQLDAVVKAVGHAQFALMQAMHK